MEQNNQSFTHWEVWKKARVLKNEVKDLVSVFPAEENYKLTNQIIRSSRSINANIAEGYERFTYKDQLHYCIKARGLLTETLNHLIDAFDCNYNSQTQLDYFKVMNDEVGRILNGYKTFFRNKLK
ncbi:MAG TPA: four helix bundle protein [Ferruginibacter sp.]|nr:four helix bundle protein [Ferruginibacter sp.]